MAGRPTQLAPRNLENQRIVESLEKVSSSLDRNLAAAKAESSPAKASERRSGGGLLEKGEGIVGGAFGVMSQRSPFAAYGQAAKGIGGMLESSGVPGLSQVGSVVKFTGELAQAADKLRAWGNQLMAVNFELSQFSGSMMAIQAEYNVRQRYIKMGQGEARADSTAKLVETMLTLNETMAPLEDLWANFQSDVGSLLIPYLKEGVEMLKALLKKFGVTIPERVDHDVGERAFQKALEDVVARRPARMGGMRMGGRD